MANPAYRAHHFAMPRGLSPRRQSQVWLCAYTDLHATVVAVRGEIDAANADRLRSRVCRLIPAATALIVDLSDVEFLGVAGLRALITIGEQCAEANRRWALITSDAVTVLLRAADYRHNLPAASSMAQARHLATAAVGGRPTPPITPSGANAMLAGRRQ